MNRRIVVAVAMLSVLWGGLNAAAAPTAPITVSLKQSDGSVFEAVPKGDEYVSWMETLGGHTIVKSGATWYYATLDANGDLVATTTRVGSADARSLAAIPEGLHPSADSIDRITGPKRSIAPIGKSQSDMTQFASSPHTQPVLVVLMEFNNRTLTGGAAAATTAFSNLIFGASNSVKDYYAETSYGNFNIVPATESYGTANDGIVVASYGANHPDPGSAFSLVLPVITAAFSDADPFINYASFNTNADSELTPEELSVIVIFAGYETSYGGSSAKHPNVWGHMSTANDYTSADAGTHLYWYTAFGERHALTSGPDNIATIGIMCHELGHLMFGLPDLYDTDSSSEGIGDWGLMGGGSWNGVVRSGDSPSYMSAWSKVVTGMVAPTDVLSGAVGATIQNATANADIKRLWVDRYRVREHFLIENRRLTGYDAGLDGSGLLIWHIDDSLTSNTNDTHRLVDLEEADGLNHLDSKSNRGDGGDVFPGTSNKVTFNGSSNPNSDDYLNADTGITVTSISASAATMTANLTPSATGAKGDNIRYDEAGAGAGDWFWSTGSNVQWSAMRVTNTSSKDRLEGLEVYTRGSATVDVYIYQSMVSNTPTTLLASKLGNATLPGWNRILLNAPIAFPAASDRIIVLKINDPGSGGGPLAIDISLPPSGRCYNDADGVGAFSPLFDLNQVALVGSEAVPNVAPTITGQSPATISQNASYAIYLSSLIVTDPDNTYPIGFTQTLGAGANYTVSNGIVVTPTTGFTGTLTVPVKVNDGIADSPWFNFTITVQALPGTITVLSPNGGESWEKGTYQAITWSTTGIIGANVRIKRWFGPTVYSVVSSTPNDGFYLWKLPTSLVAGSNHKLQILSYSNPLISDYSDNNFTVINVIPRTITVTSPNGGPPAIVRGTTVPITWNTSGGPIDTVKIKLIKGTTAKLLIASTPNDGTYDWVVPLTQGVGTNFKIRVEWTTSSGIKDLSDTTFAIQ